MPHTSCGQSRLTASVTAPHHYDVEDLRMSEHLADDDNTKSRRGCLSVALSVIKEGMKPYILPFLFMLIHQAIALAEPPKQRFTPHVVHIMDLRTDQDGKTLSYPSYVFVDKKQGEIYVTDPGNARVLVYTEDGYPAFVLDANRKIRAPSGVFVDEAGYVYVCQVRAGRLPRARISILDPCFRWVRDILFVGFDGAEEFVPRSIVVKRNGRIYVTGDGFTGVVVLKADGTFSHILAPEDVLLGQRLKADICAANLDERGRLFLVSEGCGRVYVYDEGERFLFKFGQKGGSTGKLSRPRGVGIDEKRDWYYVVDYMRHTISAYDRDGKYLFEFGGKGWGPGWFQYPNHLYVDHLGRILVADTFNRRVQILEVRGMAPPLQEPPRLTPSFPVLR